jgi:DNA-binding transcriptional LysR family regulator
MVVQTGSISLAAEQINLSQPALTQGLTKLEAQLATKLFERRPKDMESPPPAACWPRVRTRPSATLPKDCAR